MKTFQDAGRLTLLSAVLLLPLAGCKSGPAPVSDESLANAVRAQLSSDAALSGQPIQPVVSQGVVTLTGSASNDAQRTIAARDAVAVAGVKEVRNSILLSAPPVVAQAIVPPAPSAEVIAPPPPPPLRAPERKAPVVMPPRPRPVAPPPPVAYRQPAPIERSPQPSQQAYQPPPPPPPPAAPALRTVTIPAGTTLPVRVTQTLDSATTQQGDRFSGVIASDVVVDGLVAIPAGSAVSGQVDAVQEAAHFKGASLLTVSLASVSKRGDRMSIATDPYTVEGKSRGKNTALKTGGGAAVGAILGGIFGGGKGAAIGAAAGGGVGAGSNAVTRGQQVQIASETVVRFRLTSPVTTKARADASRESGDNGDPSLMKRNNQ